MLPVPEKVEKNQKFSKNLKKLPKYIILKLEKHSNASRGYAVTYYQALEEVLLLLRLEKPKKIIILFFLKTLTKLQVSFKKTAEICDFKKFETIPWLIQVIH